MTHINKDQMALGNLGGKLFSYSIKYNQKEGIENPDQVQFSGKNVKAKYNGNIAEVDWRAMETLGVNPSSTPKRYGYAYDNLNRLTAGYYQNPDNPYSKENTESLDYDLNGNITNLYRTSVISYGTNTATVIDDLTYTYAEGGNKLTGITDSSQNQTGYENYPPTYPINYDLNGNMLSMSGKGISSIQYNFLNLPNEINMGVYSPFDVNHTYRADGSKLRKNTVSTVSGFVNSIVTTEVTDYLDGFQYKNTKVETLGGGGGPGDVELLLAAPVETRRAMEMEAFSLEDLIEPSDPGIINPIGGITANVKTQDLQFFPTAEGFYDYQKDQYIYQYKDHLGNARVSFGKNNAGVLEITDANDYYPFGMNHLKTGNAFFGSGSYKSYKYNGKELQESGMYDYGARFYMPDIGRWGVVDPLAEKYTRMSPYTYVGNNPAIFVDYDGRDYGVYIDFKTGTITIKATYYATAAHMNSAQGATKLWNDMSGKYNYVYKDANGNKVSLKVNFQLTTSEVTPEKNQSTRQAVEKAAQNDPEGNSYRIAPDSSFDSETVMGVTAIGKYARVRNGQEDVNTGTGGHEVGHTLGVGDGNNIMGGQESTTITPSHISEVLNAIDSTPENPNQSTTTSNPRATIQIENNKLKTDKEYENFRKGKVKSAD